MEELGTAICRSLSEHGFVVVANCLPGFPDMDEWRVTNARQGFDFHCVEGDVADLESCREMVDRIESRIGPIDVLVNNAGITRDSVFARMERPDWDAVIEVNLTSIFNVTRQVLPAMAERGWGRVINISSVNGVKGPFGQAGYSAAKAGMLGFTRAIAQEVARKGVTVNAIAPGYIGTDMVTAIKPEEREKLVAQIPVGRFGKPEEIGHLVAYLASDYAGYMTGATLHPNGGLHMA
jgi:acetoacetyl-CoA reductase